MINNIATMDAATQLVSLPAKSPLITIKIVFRTGSASDPADKPGLAALTAAMLAGGGTKTKTYKQIVDAFYPMATGVSSQTDKEMVTFSGVTHIDNLDGFYSLFREMLLEPGWRTDDLERLRDDQMNFLRVNLRGSNDEELAKEVLYNEIYQGHPYGHHNQGTIGSLQKITVADMQKFYNDNFTRANLIVGIAGGYPESFPKKIESDFSKLAKGSDAQMKLPEPKAPDGIRVTMVEKQTRSVAYSIGFPIGVTRSHPDYPALLVAQSYFGQHRNSSGRLYNRMRESRGLNYGDYAYIEYFPKGMFLLDPQPNLARRQQIFQIWIRPVEPDNAHFAFRLAMFEFDRLIKDGIGEEDFQRTRSFLTKYVNLLMKTKNAELGYAIDSKVYGIPEYGTYIKSSLSKLTRDDVNRAIRKQLSTNNLDIVVVAQDCEALKQKLMTNAPSPITYNSPKPEAILAEDKTVQSWPLPIKPDATKIIPVDRIFE
jgi:zinc protease